MKKILSVFMLGAMIASCTAPSNKGYEVNGSFMDSAMDSSKLFLVDGDSVIDSTIVAGKNFAFKGETDTFLVYRIAAKSNVRGQVRYNTVARVILEAGTKANVTVAQNVLVDDNGGVNSICSKFFQDYTDTYSNEVAVYQKLVEAKASQDSLMAYAEGVRVKLSNLWKDAVKQNKDNLAGASIFSDFCYEVQDPAEFDSIYQSLKYAFAFDRVKAQKEVFERIAATAEGKMFADFGGKDLDGKDIKLSDFVGKGKYVLVDFWASWCGPCRQEIPNLLKVNKKYNGSNFMVLGVDVWDKEADFKQALKEENVDYPQIFTESKEAPALYGINGIPHIILFAPDGTILKRGLRGNAIEEVVKEYIKK